MDNNFNNMGYDPNQQPVQPQQPMEQQMQTSQPVQQMPGPIKKKSPIGIIILGVVIVAIVVVGVVVFLKNKDRGNSNTNKEEIKETEKPSEKKEETGFYIIDYDYASLKEGGDGSKMNYVQGTPGLADYYELDELPNKYWENNKITMDKIFANTFSEPNSRFLYPFVDSSLDDYYIYNLDNKSTVKEAFEKGWYAIHGFRFVNSSKDYSFSDEKAVFDAVIPGLGRPYTVIEYNKQDYNESEYEFRHVYIIYKYDAFYMVLSYYESTNGEKRNMEMSEGYLVKSDDMLQALIKDNFTSNNISSYTQKYLYKNKSNFELIS